jgi:hypothetical protein
MQIIGMKFWLGSISETEDRRRSSDSTMLVGTRTVLGGESGRSPLGGSSNACGRRGLSTGSGRVRRRRGRLESKGRGVPVNLLAPALTESAPVSLLLISLGGSFETRGRFLQVFQHLTMPA